MNVHPNQRMRSEPVVSYETIYRKHQKLFKQAGLWSIAFLILLFFGIDRVITLWIVGGKVDVIVILFIGLIIACVLGLLDRLPTMVKAHSASREHSIMMVLSCKKILSTYREQLANVRYDILSLDRLSDQGISPQEFERVIRDILTATAVKKPKAKVTSKRPVKKKSNISEPLDAKSLENQKESILLSLREREHEINSRVRKETLSKAEANVLIESARREAKKKLQELGVSEI